MKKNIVIIILIAIIVVIFITFGVLFWNGTISFNKEVNNDCTQQISNSEGEKGSEILTEEEANSIGRNLYDKATEIYSVWQLYPYCGYSNLENLEEVELGDYAYGNGSYYESEFSSLNELKDYLKQYLSVDIVEEKVVESYQWNGETYYDYVTDLSLLSSGDQHYTYVDYVLKDNKLYCRLQSSKGWLNATYLDEYSLDASLIEDNKIEFKVTSTYISDDTYQKSLNNASECSKDNVDKCTDSDKIYKDTKFVIEKVNDNWVVTDYTLHD